MKKLEAILRQIEVFTTTTCNLMERSDAILSVAGQILTSRILPGSIWRSKINKDGTNSWGYFERPRGRKATRVYGKKRRIRRRTLNLLESRTRANHQFCKIIALSSRSTLCIRQRRRRNTRLLRSVTQNKTHWCRFKINQLWWRKTIFLSILRFST